MSEDFNKVCTACKETKDLELFYADPKGKSGRASQCKECICKKAREYKIHKIEKDPSFFKRKEKASRELKREKEPDYFAHTNKEYRARLKASGDTSGKDYHLRRKYGITYDEYMQMAEDQGFCCEVCKTHKDELGSQGLCVDHCHTTGRVRALLCQGCNSAVGYVKENALTAERLVEYIREVCNNG